MIDCRDPSRSVYFRTGQTARRAAGFSLRKSVEVMLKKTGPILIFLCVFAGNTHPAVPRRSISDEQLVAAAQLVASGAYVEIYQHGVAVEPSFLKIMESAYDEVQRVTGLKLDTATLGSKVRVYVSDAIGVSHVWRGYQHPSDPKAIIFLNLRAYRGAMEGRNATYVHELTHLFTWRYHSDAQSVTTTSSMHSVNSASVFALRPEWT